MISSNCRSCIIAVICVFFVIAAPASAFVANSLDITVNRNGDATALFKFTLEGIIENAIPQSVLEEELKKGLSTGSEPPVLLADDRSSATILMKDFADTADVATGTEYRTESMDFTRAQIALKNSALSSVITADFSPERITITFPDGYTQNFSRVDTLPSVTHTVIDPSKQVSPGFQPVTGTINVTSFPAGAEVYIDDVPVGSSPGSFGDIQPGNRTLILRKEGFDPAERTITVTKGQTTDVTLLLDYEAPTPLPSQPGFHLLPGFSGLVALLALAIIVLAAVRKHR